MNDVKGTFNAIGGFKMGRYKYISKLEVLESDDPKVEAEQIMWMLGKRHNYQSLGRLDKEGKKFVYFKFRVLETIHLPRLMKKQEAWDYFDEHIKPKEEKLIT